MIKAVLIDLDDTLVAFDAVTESSWQQVVEGYCERQSTVGQGTILATIAKASHEFWSDPGRHLIGRNDLLATRRRIVAGAFEKLGLPADEGDELADTYSDVRTTNMYVLPGARETLDHLRDRDLQLCMVTNGDSATQWQKINRFDLAGYFDHILVEGDMGFGKPDDRVYEVALSRLDMTPSLMCMVGDNLEWDVIGAIRSGMTGYWIDRKGEGVPTDASAQPTGILDSFRELPSKLWPIES